MKPKKNLLLLDLTKWIKKVQSFPITKIDKFDNLLSDLANEVYDIYEYVIENPMELKSSDIVKLDKIHKQASELLNVLYDINIDSKYMDRLQLELETIVKKIPKILKPFRY